MEWDNNSSFKYQTQIYSGDKPTFIRAETYPGHCIADRLNITSHHNNRIPTQVYHSDHRGLSIQILDNSSSMNPKNPAPRRFNFKATDWNQFAATLKANYNVSVPTNRNLNIEEIDSTLSKISDQIITTINSTVPRASSSDSVKKYLTRRIIRLQKAKSSMLTQYHRCFDSDCRCKIQNTRSVKKLLTDLRLAIQHEFDKFVERYWKNLYRKIDFRKSHEFMPAINKIFRPKPRETLPDIHVKDTEVHILQRSQYNEDNAQKIGDEVIVSYPSDKLNVIGAYYETINSPRHLNNGTRLREIIDIKTQQFKTGFDEARANGDTITVFSDNNHASFPSTEECSYFTSPLKLAGIIKRVPNKTSSGIDGIPNVVLKNLLEEVIADYATKGKPPNAPSSYRPISLTITISKVYEAVVTNAIVKHCNEKDVIPGNQFGFRFRHSTTHAINKFLSDANQELQAGNMIGATLIDLEKAFDSMWLDGLLYKLLKKEFPDHLIRLIWDMIREKQFCTCENAATSSIDFSIAEGLQQGTVNSPVLFSIFTADILSAFGMNSGSDARSIAYADDLIVYITGKRAPKIPDELQILVNKVNNLYATWNLRLNPTKCETILIRRPYRLIGGSGRKGIKDFSISTHHLETREKIDIPTCQSVRYLGMILDCRIRCAIHPGTQLTKARNRCRSLERLFHNSHINKRAKVICYLILVRPLLTYAAPVWWNTGVAQMEKIRRFERQCLRAALKLYRTQESDYLLSVSNKSLYNEAEIPRIDNFIIELTRNYNQGLGGIKNQTIESLVNVDPTYVSQAAATGYFLPQSFTYFDRLGNTQDANNIPTIYHRSRHKTNKALPLNSDELGRTKYSTAIPEIDLAVNLEF
ncbi:uncharacterized protein LOC107043975 [Diachasma alloeum]|uniref:uncharacterized protein LOC107043975 n=1 Tax=Diachasma alloeum TaxID=454923 RepID=UPI0007384614|nr:uncharacterized protein LOC107043975 [Diachasma alloeum]